MSLFQLGKFISHAGNELEWKIECDALTDEDWDCLAKMISERCEFGSVYGIPRGGVKLQNALEKYCTKGNHIRLVVDDVYTTGKSMRDVMVGDDIGFVVFARKHVEVTAQYYIRALFTMDVI